MAIEIERKFLLESLPEAYKQNPVEIQQGYLLICPDGSEFRVRKKGELFLQTLKKPLAEGRTEIETEISQKLFEEFWLLTAGKRLEKTRFYYPLQQEAMAEIDVYKGRNKGLIVIEVEFDSIEASRKFTPPAWFGKEITGKRKYKNQNLAT